MMRRTDSYLCLPRQLTKTHPYHCAKFCQRTWRTLPPHKNHTESRCSYTHIQSNTPPSKIPIKNRDPANILKHQNQYHRIRQSKGPFNSYVAVVPLLHQPLSHQPKNDDQQHAHHHQEFPPPPTTPPPPPHPHHPSLSSPPCKRCICL